MPINRFSHAPPPEFAPSVPLALCRNHWDRGEDPLGHTQSAKAVQDAVHREGRVTGAAGLGGLEGQFLRLLRTNGRQETRKPAAQTPAEQRPPGLAGTAARERHLPAKERPGR